MKQIITDGNEACANASYNFTEVAGIYPITPSSPMPEALDKWANDGKENIFGNTVKVIEMQSEAGAIGMVHGSLQAGMLTSTYTSSQGLLLMIPNMYKIAGEMLPCTMHVAARSLATHALSIFGDHQDIYATRSTGFCMLASSSVQDAYYLSLIAHLSAIKSSLPFMHFFDGFRTSHELSKINILEQEGIKNLIDKEALNKFRQKALNIHNPVTRGTNQNGDIYFQITEARNKYYDKAVDNVIFYMNQINKLSKTDYKPFNYYGNKNAEKVIVAMGSVCQTIKETIDYLKGKIGLIEVHLYRPFSTKHLLNVLPKTVQKIAVLDRTKETGSGEPLYLDIVEALKDKNIEIVGGRYGLSSKDTTPGMIKAVFDMLDKPKNNFTIGIEDDVTNLSLPYKELDISNSLEYLIYGYGSDGMVSASKSIIEIAGEEGKYVQGYFEYDSKKSGGVTVSHLRFSDNPIKSSYFVKTPKLIVISKDTYLDEFDAITNIEKNGKLIINTNKDEKELLKALNPYKKTLLEKNIKVYIINANALAESIGLGRKISMIMESAIISLMDFIDYQKALLKIKEFIKTKFIKRGPKVVDANIQGIKKAKEYLKEITLDKETSTLEFKTENIYETISKREGDNLKVSDFNGMIDGTVKHTLPPVKAISDVVPKWNSEACIQCGMCSLVCPHGVIRTFLVDEKEYKTLPESIKSKCVPAISPKNYYFVIGIAKDKCTGCGVCIKTCPGKKGIKALTSQDYAYDDEFDYLLKNIKEKDLFKGSIKGTQLKMPKFAFHGACAGCGQTAYIKLLTQMFGENLIIANATGCSSIYGASMPTVPYEIPWANSLFEDNAEFGYGILKGYEHGREQIHAYMEKEKDPLFEMWLNNYNDFEVTKKVYESINYKKHPALEEYKNYIIKPSIWAIGGDGWAYDIGFSGIDHILSSGDNINILVLDSQVYSNTGGQASKATPKGAISKFASHGKQGIKKDLARIAMCYPNVYVAQISLGANMVQTIKAFEEAEKHNGPSIIIAYTPCISHGIIGGMGESINIESLATKCGYFPIFRYDGENFNLDCSPDFDLYNEFLNKQTRYAALDEINPSKAKELLIQNKENAMKRYNYYKNLSE